MGADLILICFGIKDGRNLEDVKKKLLQEIDSLGIADRQEIATYYYNIGDNVEDLTDAELVEKAKTEFKGVVEELFQCLDYRDVSYILYKGDRIYVTGGMSYGDNPTESYDDFDRFCNLPSKILKNAEIY